MSRDWQRVAERCDKRAFGVEEISAAFVRALERDCEREIIPSFIDLAWRIFSNAEPLLFAVSIGDQLETARKQAGSGIGRLVLEQAILAAERGMTGREGLVTAFTYALGTRAAKATKQIEEHYCRESSNPRATHVRARMEQTIGAASLNTLAQKLIKNERSSSTPTLLKQGLDDGPEK